MKVRLSTSLIAVAVFTVVVGETGSSVGPWLTAIDALAGLSFLACGVAAATQRHRGTLATSAFLAGLLWFSANHVEVLLYAWRPAMVLATLSVSGRRLTQPERAIVALFALDAAILPVAREPAVTFVLSLLLLVVAAIRCTPRSNALTRTLLWPEAATPVLALAMGLPTLGLLLGLPVATSVALSFVNGALTAVAGGVVLAAVIREHNLPGFIRDTAIELSDDDAAGAGGLVAIMRAGTIGRSRIEAEALAAVDAGLHLIEENRRLHNVLERQVDDVRASRRRLVDAADAERARLGRRLGGAVTSRLAELDCELSALLRETAGGLADQVRRCVDETQELKADLDRVGRGLHPRLLANRGLAAALRDLASRTPLDTRVTVPEARFSIPVETTIWYACAEGLTNIVKHASATEAHLRVETDAGGIAFCIVDDGVGGAEMVAGGGLAGLRDRLQAVGGTLQIAPCQRGTRIEGWVPCTAG